MDPLMDEMVNVTPPVAPNTSENSCLGQIVVMNVKANMQVKFVLLLVITPIICGLGIIGNILALVTFFHNRHKYRGNATFLMGLALCDNGVLLLTLAIYTVEVLYAYLDSVRLYYAWASYLKVAYYLSHVFQISAVSLTTLATIEQYLAVRLAKTQSKTLACSEASIRMRIRRKLRVPGCAQKIIMFSSLALICLFCIPKLLQVVVAHIPHCPGFGQYMIQASPFSDTWFSKELYEVWLMQIITVFVPFTLILVFNILIACQFTSSRKRESGILIVVVATVFLICNAPSVILTAMEHRFMDFLTDHDFIYALLRDICNIFVTLNSAVNFYAYLAVGFEFRKEFRQTLRGRAPWLGATFRLVSLPMKISQDVTGLNSVDPSCQDPFLRGGFGAHEIPSHTKEKGGIRRSASIEQALEWFRNKESMSNGNVEIIGNRSNSIIEVDEPDKFAFRLHCNGNQDPSNTMTYYLEDIRETLL